MNDYNFFDEYKPKKVKRTKSSGAMNLVFLIGLICFAGVIGFNYYVLLQMESEVKAVDEKLLQIKTSEDYIRVLEKDLLKNQLEKVVESLDSAGKEIEFSSLIDENLLAVIVDTMPSDVSLNSISITGSVMTLSGSSLNKPAIAEYQYRLKEIDFINSVFLAGINSGEGQSFAFTFSIDLGGGMQ